MSAPKSDWLAALAQLRVPHAEITPRQAQLSRFLDAGFPSKKLEDWKYTDLSALNDQAFAAANDSADVADLSLSFIAGCDRIVFVNGRRRPELGSGASVSAWQLDARSESPDAVTALNRALAVDGAAVHIKAGQSLPRPLQVLVVTAPGDAPDMTHLAHSIVLEPGASATVILQHVGTSAGAHFSTQTLALNLASDSKLELVRIQEEGAGTTSLLRCDAHVVERAHLALSSVDLGGALVRNDWNVALAAPHATVDLAGLYAPSGASHVDNHTRIDHFQPHGTSRELFRGVVSDKARAVFNGKIIVHPGAQKTDSEQRVANLLLSKGAEVNAKPELEIYADDVKCAHGATFGQLDEQALFYLRSRGLPAESARALLTYTFAFTALERIGHAGARRLAQRRFLARLPQGLSLEDLEGQA